MRFRSLILLIALGAGPGAAVLAAAGPAISGLSDNGPVGRYGKLEVSFSLGTAYANPYDPAQINAQVTFTGPGGVSTTVNAFYYQAYTRSGSTSGETLTPLGAPGWRARFAPALTGSWAYQVTATDAGGSSSANGAAAVTVQPSAKHGFIHVSAADPRYFAYDDGTVYVPLGEDMAWAGAGKTYQYDQWMSGLASGGGNFLRVWMAAWGMCVDWDSATHSQAYLGDYDNHQGDLWDLDHVMDTADANGQAVMLCLIHHGEFSSTTNPNWPDNIMSSVWGGPLTAPDQVWTNATAQALMQRRWRYLVARYAYSTALHSWELWNEMNWTDNFDASHTSDAAAWHSLMKASIRGQDPYQHIITTSFANGAGANYNLTWNAGMEVVQNHDYGATDWAQFASDNTASYLAAYPGKPFHLGEFGLSDDATSVAQDPTGSSIAETAWGAVMSKAASGGAPWWWDGWIPNQGLYYRWKGISSFLAGEDLDQRAYVPVRPNVSTATRSDISITPAFNNGSPWGSPSPASTFTLDPTGTLSPSANSLGSYLWGSWTAGKNPPSFVVNYAVAGQFQVQVTNASTSGTTALTVTLDGGATTLNNTAVSAGNSYSIAVPAGAHTLKVDGTGQDWIVPIYTFTNYGGILRCFALTGTAKALGWVQSRNATYWDQCASCQGGAAKPLPSVTDGVVQLTGLSNDGTWNVGWYETLNGTLTGSGAATCTGGALALTVPAITKDLAFKLTWAGPAASPTPSRTASPTPSPTRSPSVTATPSASATASPANTASVSASPSATPTPVPPGSSPTPTSSASPTFSPTPPCAGGGLLGNTNITSNSDLSGHMVGNPATLPVSGVLSAMSFFVVAGSGQARVALYADTGSGPGALLAQAGPVAVGPGNQTVPMGALALGPATYWLFIQTTAGVDLALTTGGDTLYDQPGAFGPFPGSLAAVYSNNWGLALVALICPPDTPTPTPSPPVTATASASASAMPSATQSMTPTASPSATATATVTPSPSGSPTSTVTATHSATAPASPTAGATGTASATPGGPTASATPEPCACNPSATPTGSPAPLGSGTPSPTPSATATPGGGPIQPEGPLIVLRACPVPNPDPARLAVDLSAGADDLVIRLWTPALVLVGEQHAGTAPGGWSTVALDPGLMARAPRGLGFMTLRARRGVRLSAPEAPLRFIKLN
jgi:hypothetical protein